MRPAVSILIAALLFAPRLLQGDSSHCAICGADFGDTIYIVTDKLTNEKLHICYKCSVLPEACFRCGLPVKKNYTSLPDGRFICSRDSRDAVLTEEEAKRVCAEVKEALDMLFSRFVSFPNSRIETALVDRVTLEEMFKYPGKELACPNVLGYQEPKTNHGRLTHELSLLSG